ncbi:hypothetical protein ACLOJK_031696 [Asimina triloba]
MASSSSAENSHHQILLPNSSFTDTPTPPSTPSNHHHHRFAPSDTDTFSRLLHNHLHPPALLSLPSRFRPKTNTNTTTTNSPSPPPSLPTVAFGPNLSQSLSSASVPAFFQLTHHPIPPHLPKSAELQSLSLFHDPNSTHARSHLDTWPLGFEDDDEAPPSFRFDPAPPSSSSPSLSSLKELAEALEKVGIEVVEALSRAVGFDSPMQEKGSRACSMMWVSLSSSSSSHEDGNGGGGLDPGRVYPYVVGLEYQIRRRKYSLLADSGWVSAEPDADSILVTVGDIAQVWSNGRLRKVRGRPLASSTEEEGGLSSSASSPTVSMCLLVTLSMDSIISPLLPLAESIEENREKKGDTATAGNDGKKRINKFRSISFEEYAWRVYHERFLYKDPLDRYRLLKGCITGLIALLPPSQRNTLWKNKTATPHFVEFFLPW